MSFCKTITSLVTAPITQNIALVRISGPQTYQIINKIFDRSLLKYPQKKPQLIFGKIVNSQKEVIDEVLLLCFYKPRSFTGEDMVEISCHGNLFVVNQIIELILNQGAELAEPGEFTKQAFFNGKLNLVQAQAINDLIRAPSLPAAKIALHNLNASSQKELDLLEKEVSDISATIEAKIIYPEEEEIQQLTERELIARLGNLKKKLLEVQLSGEKASSYQKGIKVVIIGKPNVGKSTFLNSLCQEERAIVSPIAGTTRDVIEVPYILKGIPLTLLDTAGIHETQDIVERIGVERSYQSLEKANIIFFLTDNSLFWSQEDENLYQKVKQKNYLLIVNKIDVANQLNVPPYIDSKKIIRVSAKNNRLEELENKISEIFASDLITNLSTYPYLSQAWQQSKLKEVIAKIDEVISGLKKKEIYLDALATCELKWIWETIRELSGKECSREELLNIIFSKFCLGK